MDELQHECGIAAIYHFDSPIPSRLAPPAGAGQRLPAHAADAARPAKSRPAGGRLHHLQSPPRQTPRHLSPDRHASSRRFGSTTRPSTKASCASLPAGRPSAIPATPPAGPTNAPTPSPSNAITAASGSGSASPSTASWPTSPSCATELLQAGRLSPDAQSRHRSHHALPELRAARRHRPDLVEVFRNLSRNFDGAYNLVFMNAHGRHGRSPAIPRVFGRCAMPRTARCSPPPAKAWP